MHKRRSSKYINAQNSTHEESIKQYQCAWFTPTLGLCPPKVSHVCDIHFIKKSYNPQQKWKNVGESNIYINSYLIKIIGNQIAGSWTKTPVARCLLGSWNNAEIVLYQQTKIVLYHKAMGHSSSICMDHSPIKTQGFPSSNHRYLCSRSADINILNC